MDDSVVRKMDVHAYRYWVMLLDAQRGIIDRSQVLGAGLSDRQISQRLKSGRWQRVHEGVYATFSGPLTREARLWAAVRRAGAGAVLSHETAAEVQGLIAPKAPGALIHITVPGDRRPVQHRQIRGVVIHRSDQGQPQLPITWKLPRTRIEDTVLDLVAAAATFEDAYSWISRAVSREFATVGMLRTAVAARSRIRWRSKLTVALGDSDEGLHFGLERRYARDIERAHGLPRAQRQARHEIDGRVHYRDNWYAEYRVCVELDGPSFHRDEQVWKDKRRDNLNLATGGVQTFRFGPVEVTELACESAAMVAVTLRRNGWQGSPHPCRRPGCTVGKGDSWMVQR
jgi:very-short-patch-repair endonuclease